MKKVYLLPLFATVLFMFSCGGEAKPEAKPEEVVEEVVAEEVVEEPAADASATLANVGVGPIKELVFAAEVDNAMAEKGKGLYASKGCTACHNPTMKIVGPAPKDIFLTRNPAWVMNMIMNPEVMVKEDADAKALLEEYNNVPMTNQQVSEADARAIVEYFRTIQFWFKKKYLKPYFFKVGLFLWFFLSKKHKKHAYVRPKTQAWTKTNLGMFLEKDSLEEKRTKFVKKSYKI